MTDLNCYFATFNCGRTPVNVDYFASNLFNGLKTNLPPDLVVLSLQEIAPIGYSFLGGSFLTPYFARFATAVHVAAEKRFEREGEYENVTVRNVGMTALMVFARSSVKEQIQWIETAGVGVGAWDMGNKGAVAARIGLEPDEDENKSTVITFVAAHLAPMEDAWKARNGDWKKICEGLVFEKDRSGNRTRTSQRHGSETEPLLASNEDGDGENDERSLFWPLSHVFFAGDLNYRTSDTPPKPEDFKNWPQPIDSVSDVHRYEHLLERDQLTRERQKNNTLNHLTEYEITFPPTYKYSEAAQKRATHANLKQDHEADGNQVWLWAKHRVPSWCDRILYLQAAKPTVHAYDALPVQPTSDHRPVVLSFQLPSGTLDAIAGDVKPPFSINPNWREARAVAKRYEFLVGLAAYLSLTWEGEILLGGTIAGILGGWLVIRALIGS